MFYNKLFQPQLDLCKAVTNVKTLYKQYMTDRAKQTAIDIDLQVISVVLFVLSCQ